MLKFPNVQLKDYVVVESGEEYEKYRVKQDKIYVSDFDKFVQETLKLKERNDN